MKKEMAVTILDQQIVLIADKALYWPDRKLLCIADAHFGKAAAYRALGQPVPHGTTADNLGRLDALICRYSCAELIFLGDFLHAPESHAPLTLATLREWRRRNSKLKCTLIRGNHDRKAGDPPSDLQFELVDEPMLLGPFAFRHTPGGHPNCHVIAGHVHPAFQWRGKGRQSLRLPCFHLAADLTVLPAFGDFTGGFSISRAPDSSIVVTDGCHLWPIP